VGSSNERHSGTGRFNVKRPLEESYRKHRGLGRSAMAPPRRVPSLIAAGLIASLFTADHAGAASVEGHCSTKVGAHGPMIACAGGKVSDFLAFLSELTGRKLEVAGPCDKRSVSYVWHQNRDKNGEAALYVLASRIGVIERMGTDRVRCLDPAEPWRPAPSPTIGTIAERFNRDGQLPRIVVESDARDLPLWDGTIVDREDFLDILRAQRQIVVEERHDQIRVRKRKGHR